MVRYFGSPTDVHHYIFCDFSGFGCIQITLVGNTTETPTKYNNMELLGKCSRGNKIAPLWHEGRAERGPSAKGVQFYCPSSTYPAIVLLVLYSIAIFLQCDPVCKKIAPLLSLDAKKLHTISLHFHKNCILKRF